MEINIDNISIAHQKEEVIKIFDNADECIKFADKFKKGYNITLHCDSLYAFLNVVKTKGYFKGIKDANV